VAVSITALACVNALGSDEGSVLAALMAGRSGVLDLREPGLPDRAAWLGPLAREPPRAPGRLARILEIVADPLGPVVAQGQRRWRADRIALALACADADADLVATARSSSTSLANDDALERLVTRWNITGPAYAVFGGAEAGTHALTTALATIEADLADAAIVAGVAALSRLDPQDPPRGEGAAILFIERRAASELRLSIDGHAALDRRLAFRIAPAEALDRALGHLGAARTLTAIAIAAHALRRGLEPRPEGRDADGDAAVVDDHGVACTLELAPT
jgi:hypothetical protein